jgi:CHAD domain-containing protein
VKRVRALLRLVKAELPATVYDRDNLYLRNIGRQLSALRDAAVIEETFAALQKEFSAQLPRRTWQAVKHSLVVRARPSNGQKEKRMMAVAAKLRTARARVEKWSLEFDEVETLQQGIRKAYRRGQRALEQALEEPTTENFHEWRKQVNHLRHQLQILQTLKLGQVKTTLREFKSLAELLGGKNDLALLSQRLRRRSKAPTTIPLALQELIQTREQALTAEAITLGQPLYQAKAKALLRSLWR